MERLYALEVPSISSPVPSYRSTFSRDDQIPGWAREVADSVQNRQRASRASSIVSTRTGTSTNTALEETRSIDLNIDGLHFRINRDGSRITTGDFRDTLPPYTPIVQAADPDIASNGNSHGRDGSDGQSATTERPESSTPHLPAASYLPIQFSSGPHMPSPRNKNMKTQPDTTLSRVPSFTPGKDTISVTKKRTVSQNDVPTVASIPRKPVGPDYRLHRRNGIRLPTLITTSLSTDPANQQPRSIDDQGAFVDSPSPHRALPRSADPTLGNDNHSYIQRPPSPAFIGRNAPGLFPLSTTIATISSPRELSDDQITVTAESPATIEEGFAETYPPPAMESENDISVHYTRLIRTIDRDNRRALHERDKDMAALRERLNEQDTIYRQQLRARDFMIDDLKSRIAHLETTTDVAVEMACNAVEDVWENRWKDRDYHLMERMRRLEADLQTAVGRAVAERDAVWAKGWSSKYQQLIKRLEVRDTLSQNDLDEFDASPPVL